MTTKGSGAQDDPLAGLDDQQRAAAMAVDGPVRIIAGAGAGKTRTITRRIAHACASGAWDPRRTMAVTFSVKAANEMRTRLQAMGVLVRAATFHSAALRQLRDVWPMLSDAWFPRVEPDGRGLLRRVAARMGSDLAGVEGSGARDLLEEINWTKVSLIAPGDYRRVCDATHRLPPMGLTPERFADVIDAYEGEKAARGVLDFNDILLLACHVLDEDGDAARAMRAGVGWLTVDEYQDVSPLQHRLMRLWMGTGRDVCVVGDPAQTIYSFAGATHWYLRDFAHEFGPLGADLRLETDYRSSPQIVRAANHVLARAQGADDYLTLRAVRADGPAVAVRRHATDAAEAADVAARIAALIRSGVRPADIAVLMRLRAQARPIGDALLAQRVPFSVRTTAQTGAPTSSAALGEREEDAPSGGFGRTGAAAGVPVADPRDVRRTLEQGLPGFVTISTIHAAKGLEWRHVFIIGASEGLLPYGTRGPRGPAGGDNLEEERRLMYVALTRGEDAVEISYAIAKDGGGMARSPSRFLTGLPRRQ